MSTAPATTLPAAHQLASLQTQAKGAFVFAFLNIGCAAFLTILGATSGDSSAGQLPFVLVSLAFTFLGMAVRQTHVVLQNQEERLARLEELTDRRSA